jgi:aspartokinase/homoserine dehydrogenase 1
MENLQQYDSHWQEKMEKALENGNTLRFVGTLKGGKISVGIEEVPQDSSLGNLSGTDNLIQIQSNRYCGNPLIIQGPGAGKQVTAAGVLADVLKIGSIITK